MGVWSGYLGACSGSMWDRAVQGEPPKLSWWGPGPTHTPSLNLTLTYRVLYEVSFENKK